MIFRHKNQNALQDEFGLPEVAAVQFGLSSLDDQVIVGICQDLFRNKLNLDPQAWDDIGPEPLPLLLFQREDPH